MPLPNTTNIGTIIDFLKREKPRMKKKRRLAIALEHVRKIMAQRNGSARISAIKNLAHK